MYYLLIWHAENKYDGRESYYGLKVLNTQQYSRYVSKLNRIDINIKLDENIHYYNNGSSLLNSIRFRILSTEEYNMFCNVFGFLAIGSQLFYDKIFERPYNKYERDEDEADEEDEDEADEADEEDEEDEEEESDEEEPSF